MEVDAIQAAYAEYGYTHVDRVNRRSDHYRWTYYLMVCHYCLDVEQEASVAGNSLCWQIYDLYEMI